VRASAQIVLDRFKDDTMFELVVAAIALLSVSIFLAHAFEAYQSQ
jgi:hypothetical protein